MNLFQSAKNLYQSGVAMVKAGCEYVGGKAMAIVGGTGAILGSLFSSNPAQAALDPNIALGLASLKTDFDSLMAQVYPIAIAITTALVIFGLVKMFIHKSVK